MGNSIEILTNRFSYEETTLTIKYKSSLKFITNQIKTFNEILTINRLRFPHSCTESEARHLDCV